jgi:hypothetical protein
MEQLRRERRKDRLAQGSANLAQPPVNVFLNIPYDARFEPLFLAYIAGLFTLGLAPRATLEIPGSTRRLEKIVELIESCRYSVHDLSRVELDRAAPRVPRFNMPFELGLTVARFWKAETSRHDWFVCESRDRRLLKALSDLNGTDAYVHDGTIAGVLRELRNMFQKPGAQPSPEEMMRVYRAVRKRKVPLLAATRSKSVYAKQVFLDLCFTAQTAAAEERE